MVTTAAPAAENGASDPEVLPEADGITDAPDVNAKDVNTPPRKGGRPPGAKDKRPRARRPRVAQPPPKKDAPDPLADAVDGDEAPAAKQKRGKAGAPKNVEELFTISAAELSALAVTCLNLGVVKAVATKFGPEAGMAFALNTEEAEAINNASERVIAKYLPKMTAEWALVFTIVMIYGGKTVTYQLSKNGMTMEDAINAAKAQEAAMRARADAKA